MNGTATRTTDCIPAATGSMAIFSKSCPGPIYQRMGRPELTQETLATMVGTTRARVNFFMKKFQRLA
jgi:hypothetical protein